MKLQTSLFAQIGFVASTMVFLLSGCDRAESPARNPADSNPIANPQQAPQQNSQQVAPQNTQQNTQQNAQQSAAESSNSMRDIEMAKKIDRAIGSDPTLGQAAIGVLSIDGVVRLTGKVSSGQDHERLIDIVRGVEGVQSIDDQIIIDVDYE
jgi:hyperosmotically inducible protein